MDLNTLANGALKEKFYHEYKKVLENIQDLNIEAKKARKLIIELSFVPNESRDMVGISILTKTKLIERDGASTLVAVGTDTNGELISKEIGNELLGQREVDVETGEVIDNRSLLKIIGER